MRPRVRVRVDVVAFHSSTICRQKGAGAAGKKRIREDVQGVLQAAQARGPECVLELAGEVILGSGEWTGRGAVKM